MPSAGRREAEAAPVARAPALGSGGARVACKVAHERVAVVGRHLPSQFERRVRNLPDLEARRLSGRRPCCVDGAGRRVERRACLVQARHRHVVRGEGGRPAHDRRASVEAVDRLGGALRRTHGRVDVGACLVPQGQRRLATEPHSELGVHVLLDRGQLPSDLNAAALRGIGAHVQRDRRYVGVVVEDAGPPAPWARAQRADRTHAEPVVLRLLSAANEQQPPRAGEVAVGGLLVAADEHLLDLVGQVGEGQPERA